jgi:hypothetical protein
VVGCSRVGFRAAVPAPVRTLRTVRVVGADRPRGGFYPGVLCILRVFLSAVVLIRLASGVWRTVRRDVADSPRDTSCSRTVRGRGTDRLRVEVPVWVILLVFNGPSAEWCGPFAWWSRTVRPRVADRPPGLLQNS